MKRKAEIKAGPNRDLTLADIGQFLDIAQGVPGDTKVKATIRFNGSLRALSVEWEDKT